MSKRKQGSPEATLFKIGVCLNESGHLEIVRESLHPNDWLSTIDNTLPSYENRDLIYNFLKYSENLLDEVEQSLRTFSSEFKPLD